MLGGHLLTSLVNWGVDVYAYPVTGPWSDVGTPESFRETTRDILHGQYPIDFDEYEPLEGSEALIHHVTRRLMGDRLQSVRFEGKCIIGGNVTIGEDTRIYESVIGSNSVIGKEVRIEESTLMPFVNVGNGSRLTGCIIGQNTRIGTRLTIPANAVLGDDLRIPEGASIGIGHRVAHMRHREEVARSRYKIVDELKGLELIVFTS